MRATKVLFFDPHSNMYGSERSLLNLLRIVKSGNSNFSICVISNCKGHQFNKELTKLNLPFYPIFKSDLHLESRLKRIVYLIKIYFICIFEQPKIIHVNQVGGLPYILFLKIFLYRRFKLVVHNRHQDDEQVFKRYRKKLYLVNQVISVSENENAKIASIIEVGKSTVIYNPFELDFKPPVKGNHNKFICASRINEIKNQMLILESLSEKECKEEFQVHFFGDVDHLDSIKYYEKMREFTIKNSLLKKVEFKGFDESITKKFNEYRILILPSLEEAMGRVIIESFINGIIPLVIDEDTGAKEIITRMGLENLLFVNNPNLLLKKMDEINSLNQEEFERIVLKAQNWISINLNDQIFLNQLDLIYA